MRTNSMGRTAWICCALTGLGVLLPTSGCGPSLGIHKALETGQTDEALALIAEGKCLKDVTLQGHTALHYAARYGSPEVAEALIDAGLDIEQTCKEQGAYKPLYFAAAYGQIAVARLLIDRGANVESENAGGATALLIAAQNGHIAAAELLIEHGADINHQAADGVSPLLASARKGQVNSVELLVKKGADKDIRTETGMTPLIYAAAFEQAAIVQFLVENGADVRAADNEGFTALMACARTGALESVRLLVDSGSDLEARFSKNSMSALHYAAFNDHVEAVEYLMSAGARFYTIEEGPGTYSTAVAAKLCGQYYEIGGRLEEAVTHYALAGQYYENAVNYFESQAQETAKRIEDVQFGNFMRQLAAGMAAGMAAYGGGYGTASYRVYDTAQLAQRKKAYLDKAGQCRKLADACRKLVDCYNEYSTPGEREDHARMWKDQLGLR